MESNNMPAELSVALQRIDHELDTLRAESLVSNLLAKHAIAILIRRSNEPMKVRDQLRHTTLEAINNLHFEGGDDRRVDNARSKAREIHEAFFSGLASRE